MEEYSLDDQFGNPKYLSQSERQRFYIAISDALGREEAPFALMIYWTGCRLSEALGVQYNHIDCSQHSIRFKTLKRRKLVYRTVPVPESFTEKLNDVYDVKQIQKSRIKKEREGVVWPYSRQWGYNQIKKVMKEAKIFGVQATPKGLRHSFVIAHQENKVPGHMIQKWAGWSSTNMLQVYGAALGQEERNLASHLWDIEK